MEVEYKFQLMIVPESYDYEEEEIVYRIFFNKQLISERSLPIMSEKQLLLDNFSCIANSKNINELLFFNTKFKKAIITQITINNYPFNFVLKSDTIDLNIDGLKIHLCIF